MEPAVTKLTRSASAYYSIQWSPLLSLVKNVVVRSIPSTAGIFEIYKYDGGRTAELIGRAKAYYGGLRNTLRGIIDPISPYPLNGELLEEGQQHLVRYSLIASSDDMDDILFFFAGRDDFEAIDQEHSGRYDFIYVKEITPDAGPDDVVPSTL